MIRNLIFLFLLILTCENVNGQIEKYFCPPCGSSCDDLTFKQPGKCPHCGMTLSTNEAVKDTSTSSMSICFYLQNNVEVLDFAGPLEVFTSAGFDVSIVSKKKEAITSQGVLSLLPTYSIDDAPPSDVMVFFGGAHTQPTNDTTVINWIKKRKSSTKYFISVCTGAFILGKAGILDGLTITTFHSAIDKLQEAVPSANVVSNVRYVDNGKVITTAGISAGIDGAFHFVAKIKGEAFAKYLANELEYEYWTPNKGLMMEEK